MVMTSNGEVALGFMSVELSVVFCSGRISLIAVYVNYELQ
jgi:hypothetical protein